MTNRRETPPTVNKIIAVLYLVKEWTKSTLWNLLLSRFKIFVENLNL